MERGLLHVIINTKNARHSQSNAEMVKTKFIPILPYISNWPIFAPPIVHMVDT